MGKCPVPARWLILQSPRKQLWFHHRHKQSYLKLADHCISLNHSMHLNPALVTTIVVLLMSVPLYKCAVATNLIRLLVMTSLCMLPIAMQTTADADMLCWDPPTPARTQMSKRLVEKKDLRYFRMYHPSRGPLSNTTWHTIVSLQALKRILFHKEVQSEDLIETYPQSVPGFPPLPCPLTDHPFLPRCDSHWPRCRKDFSSARAEKIVWHLKNLPQWNVNWHTFELIFVWQDKTRQDPTFVGDCRAGLGDSCGVSCLFWFWFLRITDYKIKINSQEKVYSLMFHALLSLQCKKIPFRSTAGERRIS